MVGFTLGNGWIDVGKWLDSRRVMVGFTLENGWIHVGKWLDSRREMVGLTLENGWIHVGKWLDSRWEMVGFTLENGWIDVGKWLDLRWEMVGKWLDLGWEMIGFRLENGWIYVGKWLDLWLDLGWEMVGFRFIIITILLYLSKQVYASYHSTLVAPQLKENDENVKILSTLFLAISGHWEMNEMDGMGKLRITKRGIRVEGEAEFMSSVQASRIQTEQEVPLSIQSTSNITMTVYGNDGRRTNSLFIGDSYIEAKCDEFKICDKDENILFEVNKDEVLFAVNTLRLPDNPETNQGGLVFDGSIQTNLLHSGLHSSLRLQAPTRKIQIDGPEGVSLEAKAGGIGASSAQDLKLKSIDGAISLDSRHIELKNLRTSEPNTDDDEVISKETDIPVYQLCVCDNGKLFLSLPSGNCKADDLVCQ
ncbi:Zeta-sarcoglycan [Nymphon striatum]|nr:Zeta-sarcoglycan [Nymphon striatum]